MNRSTGLALGAALTFSSIIGGPSLAASPPPNGGTIAIQPKTVEGYDPSMPAFVDAATAALNAKGFTILDDPNHTAYVGELTLSRTAVGTGFGKDRGGASASVVGTGVVVPFSTGQSSVVTLQRTRLELRIRKRGEEGIVWDGTAVTVRPTGSRNGTDEAVATDLSNALLQIYPALPTEVVGIP
jgi:hypothetical protein